MEPYRTSGFRCPTCPDTPVREFQNRLICDECHGMMIDVADYVASCADLCSQDLTLAVTNEEPKANACPRCERTLSTARVTLTPVKVSADVLRCERDGLWIQQAVLTAVFARIGRTVGGRTGNQYYSGGERRGLDGLPMSRHGPASGGLAIGEWRNRPRRRSPTATPINLYREQRLPCPACTTTELRFFGDRYQCETCAGAFVQNAALESMVMDVSKAPWSMPQPSGAVGTRACPVCTTPMLAETLERVPIDRCTAHGVWFDLNELSVTLENASHQFDPRGVRAWLKKLFA